MRRKPCDVAVQSPCARAVHRRTPALFRRGAPRGGGGGRAADPNLYGLTGIASYLGYLQTPVNGGEAGVATGFGGLALVRIESQSVASASRIIIERSDTNPRGWALYTSGTNSTITGFLINGAAAYVTPNGYTIRPSDVGQILLVGIVHTGAGAQIWVQRAPAGADVPIAGYIPAAAASTIGARAGGALGADGITVLAHATFRGTPTASQRESLYDAVRALGDFPDTMAGGTITHAWSLKRELAGTVIVDGQTVPSQLTDQVTQAAADAQIQQGTALRVKRIDPSIDGRRLLGAQGFSGVNHLLSAPGAGLQGSSAGSWVSCWARADSLPTTTQILCEAFNVGPFKGFNLYTSSGPTRLGFTYTNSFGSPIDAASYTLTASDLGQMVLVTGVSTGSAIRFYRNGVQIGSDVACSGYAQPVGARFIVGNRESSPLPLTSMSVFGVSGGDGYVPTAAEIAQQFADTVAAGVIQPIGGTFGAGTKKTQHYYDLTADTLASGVDAAPAQVLDRVGVDHLTRVGGHALDVVGLRGFTLDHTFRSVGGALRGAVSGHWHEALVYKRPHTIDSQVVWNNYDGNGWYLNIFQGTAYTVMRGTSPSALINIQSPTLSNGLHHIATVYDGTKSLLYVDGALVATSAPFTYQPPAATSSAMFGGNAFTTAATVEHGICGGSGGNFVPTAGEIATAAAAALATGKVVGVPSKTDRRWSLVDDIADAGGTVPARSKDRQNTGDDMARTGSGLTLAQRTERLWSYETSPIAYGAGGATGAVYSTPNGLVGDNVGWGFVWIGSVDSQAVSAAARIVVAKRGGTVPGYQLATLGANGTLQFTVGGAASTVSPTTAAVSAGEVGKTLVVGCWYDGSRAYMMVRRLQTNASAALSGGFVASAAPMTIGARSDGFAADGVTTRGLITLTGVPTLSEMQALHDAVLALETIPAMPGRTVARYDVTRDTLAASGVLPTQLLDRIGTDHLTKTGAPALAAVYARAAA